MWSMNFMRGRRGMSWMRWVAIPVGYMSRTVSMLSGDENWLIAEPMGRTSGMIDLLYMYICIYNP